MRLLVTLAFLLSAAAPASPAAAQDTTRRAPKQFARGDAPAPRERTPALDHQFHRAQTAWQRGASMLEAKARLDYVLRALPQDVEARKLRAEVLLEMDRPEEAFEDARCAASLRPHDGMALLLHAEAARETKRLDVARQALDQAAEYLPEESAPHVRLSWNAMMLGRLSQAEAFGRVALALDSSSAPAHLQLARVFLRRERPDEAASVLAGGLRQRVVTPRLIREDDLLRTIAGHEALKSLMRP